MLAPVLVTPPAAKPVSLAEVKKHLRIEAGVTDDDDVLTALIAAGTTHLDGWSGILGRALVTQTWRQDFGGFWHPWPVMRLPLSPVQSIASVEYWDGSGGQQTLAAGAYELLVDAQGPFVSLKVGQSWPSTYSRSDAISVEFVAGYGDPADVPEALRTAIVLFVKMHFEPESERYRAAFDALVHPYRRFSV